jgi:hypothetical protein
VRINFGFKAWAGLSALLLSVAVISGCNEEGAAPTTNPAPAPSAGGAPPKKPDTVTPPPPTTKIDEKAPEKK